MTFSFATMLVITRHRRDVSMAPATFLSQLLVLAVAAVAFPGIPNNTIVELTFDRDRKSVV